MNKRKKGRKEWRKKDLKWIEYYHERIKNEKKEKKKNHHSHEKKIEIRKI